MLFLLSLTTAFVALPFPTAAKVNYDGFHIYSVSPDVASEDRDLVFQNHSATIVRDHGGHLAVAIAPDQVAGFEASGLGITTLSDNLGAVFAVEGSLQPYQRTYKAGCLPPLSWFDGYHAYADHLAFINDIQRAVPENSEILNIGNSWEGRPITALHLWGSAGPDAKPAVYMMGTTHAREWVSPAVVEYLAYQVASGFLNSTTNNTLDFLNEYDFYFVPVANPDGFVFSQTTDRMWRKNRQIRNGNLTAIGTDTNRNWPYQWDIRGGAATDPFFESYRGEAPGDTPEVQALVNLAQRLKATKGIKFFVDWHSWGQEYMVPYGYACNATVANLDKQLALARGVADIVAAQYGTTWFTGSVCKTVGYTSGGSSDYMQDMAGAELAWGVELRGSYPTMFALPPEQLLPSGVEQWAGLQYLLKNI